MIGLKSKFYFSTLGLTLIGLLFSTTEVQASSYMGQISSSTPVFIRKIASPQGNLAGNAKPGAKFEFEDEGDWQKIVSGPYKNFYISKKFIKPVEKPAEKPVEEKPSVAVEPTSTPTSTPVAAPTPEPVREVKTNPTPAPAPAPETVQEVEAKSSTYIGQISANTAVFIRKIPSPQGNLAGNAKPGAKFEFSDEGEWQKIVSGPYANFYISKKFIKPTGDVPVAKVVVEKVVEKPTPVVVATPAGTYTGEISANTPVFIRKVPSPQGNLAGHANPGTKFDFVDQGEWQKIVSGRYKNFYVSKKFIKPLTTAAPTAEAETASVEKPADTAEAATPSTVGLAPEEKPKEVAKNPKAPKVPERKWDEKVDERFQNQIDKLFKKKDKNRKDNDLSAPVYYEGLRRPLGDTQVRLLASGEVQLDYLKTIELLKKLVVEDWFKKPAFENQKDVQWLPIEKFNADGVKVEFSNQRLEVRITVAPEQRSAGVSSLNDRNGLEVEAAEPPASFSTYLNVTASDTYDSRNVTFKDHRNPAAAQLESGTNILGLVVEASGNYLEKRDSTSRIPSFTRGDVRIVKDFPTKSLRISLGDLNYPIETFQVYRPMAGLNVSTQFSMNPSKLTYPSGQYEIFLKRPSKVVVYINNRVIRELNLPAGKQSLQDVPFAAGMNNVKLEIIDDLGQVETIDKPYFSSVELLKPGLHQLSYSAGLPSETDDTMTRSYDSNNPTVSVFHKYGWTEDLTIGASYQSDKFAKIMGVEGLISTGIGYVKFEPSVSQSTTQGSGTAFSVRHIYTDNEGKDRTPRSISVGAQAQTTNYISLGQTDETLTGTLGQLNINTSRGFSKSLSGILGLNYQFNRVSDKINPTSYSVTAGLTKQWDMGITLSGTLTRTRTPAGDDDFSVLLFLTWSFPEDKQSATLSHNSHDQSSSLNWNYNPSSGAETASYSAGANEDPQKKSYNGQVSYTGNRFRGGVTYQEAIQSVGVDASGAPVRQASQSLNVQLASALVFADGYFAISRPVANSFAIIAPIKNLKDKTLILNREARGTFSSKTDFFGAATVSELPAYNSAKISIASDNLTAGASLPHDHFNIFPTYKNGYVFPVGSDATVYLFVKLKRKNGEMVSNIGGRAVDLTHPDAAPILIFTNRKGLIGSEGFRPGRYRLEMADDFPPVEITIPEDAKDEFDLGTVTVGDSP